MSIFSKKDCSICGEKSGLLSNQKLADGNLCKNCRAKLSPFYELTSDDTVAEIVAQLNYREQNRQALQFFHPTIAVGEEGKVYIDPQSGKFTLAREDDFRNGNPDLFDLSMVRSCDLYISEREDAGDENTPASYDYNFFLEVELNHPFLEGASFGYNRLTVTSNRRRISQSEIEQIYRGQKEMRGGVASFFTGVDKRATEQYLELYGIGQQMVGALTSACAAAGVNLGYQAPAQPVYQVPVQQAPAQAAPIQPAPATPQRNFCPNCGARVSGGSFCTGCGARLG